MAPRWHHGTIAPRSPQNKKKQLILGNFPKVNLSFQGPRGPGSMREPLEIVTASRMQDMVQSVRKTLISWPTYFFQVFDLFFGGSRRWAPPPPHGGAIILNSCLICLNVLLVPFVYEVSKSYSGVFNIWSKITREASIGPGGGPHPQTHHPTSGIPKSQGSLYFWWRFPIGFCRFFGMTLWLNF